MEKKLLYILMRILEMQLVQLPFQKFSLIASYFIHSSLMSSKHKYLSMNLETQLLKTSIMSLLWLVPQFPPQKPKKSMFISTHYCLEMIKKISMMQLKRSKFKFSQELYSVMQMLKLLQAKHQKI